MGRSWKSVGVMGVAVTLAAVSSVAVAQGASSKGPKGPIRGPVVKRLMQHAVHADVSLIRVDGSSDTMSIDRGVVTTKTDTSLTLLRRDGKSVTLGLGTGTKVAGTIHVGRQSLVLSRSGVAFRVQAPQPGPSMATAVAKAKVAHADASIVRADGSTSQVTFDRGQVTAVTTTSLTVKRGDGKSVTLDVQVGAKIQGRLVVGGTAAALSQGGVAFQIVARAGT